MAKITCDWKLDILLAICIPQADYVYTWTVCGSVGEKDERKKRIENTTKQSKQDPDALIP